MLPTFVVIGAMKAGTTTLYAHLAAHPQVFLTRPKEPQFFTTRWDRGLPGYEALFDGAGDALARGEASTSYTDHPRKPEAPERMAALLPDVRLVYVVRDPVDRMRSHYRHDVADGRETRPVAEALPDPRYVDRSRYAMQARRYLDHFPADHLLVVSAERLFEAPAEVLARVHAFLGVDVRPPDPDVHANSGDRRMALNARGRRLRGRWRRTGVYRALPGPVRRGIRRTVTRPGTGLDHGTVDAALRDRLYELLADDMRGIEAIAGEQLFRASPRAGPL